MSVFYNTASVKKRRTGERPIIIGSAGFSFYVAQFGSYDKTYGSLGAVVVLLMWFYVSAFIVLAGAELNAEIEKAAVAPLTSTPKSADP